ncbi:MAG: DNA helicase [Gemmatimonadetes bacterium]|nr:DNA helicase [Gemmatimonadota bacterium]
MVATVRNRRGLVTSVAPFAAAEHGVVHLVGVEYFDSDGAPDDQLLWEREPGASLLEPTALPAINAHPAMLPDELDAMVRAARWSALTPYLDPDGTLGPLERLPVTSPLHGAIQAEDYQLVPLLKALRMPRVTLLLADDVGLGKTIEAGLILTELLLRRRVRRVLVLCPASLRLQWQQELRDKFCLAFDVVDRPATHALQRRLGLDANPWRTFSRVITSYDYLKQPDVFERFVAASRVRDDAPSLPWDLLIVDEAHNLAPAPFGVDSDVATMLQRLVPLTEHRLFLSATPHNGYTRSFTGLLETLDPVRFTRKSDPLTAAEQGRVEQVVIRRLKREINASGPVPRFAARHPEALPVAFGDNEVALAQAFGEFRRAVWRAVAGGSRGSQLSGRFAVEVLGKRRLSGPATFADSWNRYLQGLASGDDTADSEVQAVERSYREGLADDREAESRVQHAARTVGSWLKPYVDQLEPAMKLIGGALKMLNLLGVATEQMVPDHDARFIALCAMIDRLLIQPGGGFRNDERLIVFTEYKTTLDYLGRLLAARYPEADRLLMLYGGMEDKERDSIKGAFNDPTASVRILLATDAAAEGLNLQATARYLLHYDLPWNPARIEQRNGRLDRHGQARDVTAFHFTSPDDADVAFMDYVARKVDVIREDLGATEELFDRAVEQRLLFDASDAEVKRDLEQATTAVAGVVNVPRDQTPSVTATEADQVKALVRELDLDATTLRDTLDLALGIEGGGRPRLEGPDGRGMFRLRQPIPATWTDLVDDYLRFPSGPRKGALPGLLFDPQLLIRMVEGRPVFTPAPDGQLLHLGHPLFHRALQLLSQARFPGSLRSTSRWSVRSGGIPDGADALVLLTIEELAVNELRETFHHWVRTVVFPVRDGKLGAALGHRPASEIRGANGVVPSQEQIRRGRDLWDEVEPGIRTWLTQSARDITGRLVETLAVDGAQATERERALYQSRQGELSRLIELATTQRLEREVADLRAERAQIGLFETADRVAELDRSIAAREEEVGRRRSHYEELRRQLTIERDRILQRVLPKRFALRGETQLFPVAIEIRLPEVARR